MSASNELTEWHLTPNGWVRGSTERDPRIIVIKPTPEGTVLTCKYREYSSSSFSGLDKFTETIWASENQQQVQELKEQFGDCPAEL